MLKKILIIFLFLSLILVNGYMTISYATAVKVTDENLKSSLQKFVSSSDNDKNYNITVENKQIKITSDDGNYTINYDLTNKPTFTYEADIAQGMSYKDFQEKTNGSSSTMIGYIAVADIQGVGYEDSLSYFAMCLLASAFSGSGTIDLSNSYMIVDDTQEGVTFEKDPNDTKTIYVSEFGNRVMEYANSMYAEKQTFKDTDGLNTFEMSTEMKDKTSTSAKLVTTLTVDTDADFSQMKGYAEQMANAFNGNNNNNNDTNNNNNTNNSNNNNNSSNGSSTTNNNNNNNNSNENKATTTSQSSSSSSSSSSKSSESTKDTTASKTTLPKTGTTDTVILIAVISICSILAITFGIKNRKYKDIK